MDSSERSQNRDCKCFRMTVLSTWLQSPSCFHTYLIFKLLYPSCFHTFPFDLIIALGCRFLVAFSIPISFFEIENFYIYHRITITLYISSRMKLVVGKLHISVLCNSFVWVPVLSLLITTYIIATKLACNSY